MFKKIYIAGIIFIVAMAIVGSSLNKTESKSSKLSADDIRGAYSDSFDNEKSQDYDKAIEALDAVIGEYPDAYTPNLRLGWLNYLNEDYEESVKYYQKAIKAVPGSIEAKNGATLPLLALKNYDDVISLANQVIKVDPLNYTANLRIAYVARLRKKYDDAEKTAGKMLALYPTDISFTTELALDKYAKGDKTTAGELMWNVLVLDPENVTANNYFGK